MKERQNRNTIALQLLKYHIGGLLVLCAVLLMLHLFLEQQLQGLFSNLENIGGFSFLGVLDVQISVSFIVVSIVTIFAQKTITIYWEDIMQYKLIRPRFTNFNAMASYIFADLLLSIVFILCGCRYVYLTFFFAIILIMVLSLKMLAAFFSGDLIRAELEKTYQLEQKNRSMDKTARDSYRAHKRKLIQYTLQAIEENEIDTVCENMAFLYKFKEYSDTSYLIRTMVAGGRLYMFSRVAKVCECIFSSQEQIEEYDRICRSLVAALDEGASGYIQSIYKSMGEYTSENDAEMFKSLREKTDSFCTFCREHGHKDLAEKIQKDYVQQSQFADKTVS